MIKVFKGNSSSYSDVICNLNNDKVYEKNSTCFHIANVYSLLGLIYVKLKDYGRATALYKKSLLLELPCQQHPVY